MSDGKPNVDADAQRYRDALVEGYRNGSVKVHVSIAEDEAPWGGETLWASRTDKPDEFIIDNIPFFAYGIAYLDRVRAYHPDDAPNPNYFEFESVAEPGKYVTARMVATTEVVDQLKAAFPDGLSVERGFDAADGSLFSLAVERTARDAVARWLRQQDDLMWEWA